MNRPHKVGRLGDAVAGGCADGHRSKAHGHAQPRERGTVLHEERTLQPASQAIETSEIVGVHCGGVVVASFDEAGQLDGRVQIVNKGHGQDRHELLGYHEWMVGRDFSPEQSDGIGKNEIDGLGDDGRIFADVVAVHALFLNRQPGQGIHLSNTELEGSGIPSHALKKPDSGLGMDALPKAPVPMVPVKPLPLSPALQVQGKMTATLEGRTVGLLVADGSDALVITNMRRAVTEAGARVRVIAAHIGSVRLSDQTTLDVDGQVAGSPSVLFDAIAVVASPEVGRQWVHDALVSRFLGDAWGHLKAVALDHGGRALWTALGLGLGNGVVDAADLTGFLSSARTRMWDREVLAPS